MLPLALLNLGPWEIALIIVLALLLFGGKKLPSLAKDLGSGIKEFRRSLSASSEEEPPPAPQVQQVSVAPAPVVEAPPAQVVEEPKTRKKSKKKS